VRLWRLLALPWCALSQTARGVTAMLAGIALLLVFLGGVLTHNQTPDWSRRAADGIAMLNAVAWAGLLSQTLLLARDAHRLRFPALEREVVISLGLYVLLTMVLPALWIGLLDGHVRMSVISVALGAGAGMAYAILPGYLSILITFTVVLWPGLGLPGPTQPGFTMLAGACAVLLWLLITWRWHVVVRNEQAMQGSGAPTILKLRSNLLYGRMGFGGVGNEARLIRQRPNWLQPGVDLRGSGPGNPQRSLRVALGGWAMPQTPVSRLRQGAFVLLGIGLVALLLTLQMKADDGHEAWQALLSSEGIKALTWYGALSGLLMAITRASQLRQRWGKSNTELPLLALLPGLGDAAQVKRILLRASLLPCLAMQSLLLLASLSLAGWSHLGVQGDLLLLLSQMGGMGLTAALALEVLGGVRLQVWGLTALVVSSYVWIVINITIAVPLFHDGGPIVLGNVGAGWLAAGWAAFTVALLWLGRRGWRGLQQRPHPFLPN
jgi:hypothetical protein